MRPWDGDTGMRCTPRTQDLRLLQFHRKWQYVKLCLVWITRNTGMKRERKMENRKQQTLHFLKRLWVWLSHELLEFTSSTRKKKWQLCERGVGLQKGHIEFFTSKLSFNIAQKSVCICSVTQGTTAVPLRSVCNVELIRVISSWPHTNNYISLRSCE